MWTKAFQRVVMWIGVLLCCVFLGCGDDDLEFGGEEESPLRIGKDEPDLSFGERSGGGSSGSREIEATTVQGNVFNLQPATSRPVAVFVFVDLRDPGTFRDFRDAEVGLVADDRTFTVSNLTGGDLTVVFFLDEAGVNQDGTLDPGDPIALFQDPTGRLRNLSASTDVTLQDVDVTFNLDVPEAGMATVQTEANIIVTQKPSPETPTSDSSA